jgi:hypothetical protein
MELGGKVTDIELVSPTEELDALVADWLGDYITKPHPELGRDGPVCPFVESSHRADSLVVRSYHWNHEFELSHMIRVVEKSIETFHSIEWKSRNSALWSLVVTVSGLSAEAYWLIDEAHRVAKDGIVAQGLMLGQFHPNCDARAARNLGFPVNKAPIPLFVVRNMAFHDILFLHGNTDWFVHYKERYGRYYERRTRLDAEFVDFFESACKRLGEQELLLPAAGSGSIQSMPV